MFDVAELINIENKEHANSTVKAPIQESFHRCSGLITQKNVLLLVQAAGLM
jgi:hypothetical protein